MWGCLILGFALVITCWFVISRITHGYSRGKNKIHPLLNQRGKIVVKRKLFRPFEYAFSVLLSQGNQYWNPYLKYQVLINISLTGNFCLETSLSIRLIAAAWCLAAFVLYPAYSGTLISFIMSPNIRPIINSIRDIENVTGLSIAVDRGLATDALLQVIYMKEGSCNWADWQPVSFATGCKQKRNKLWTNG